MDASLVDGLPKSPSKSWFDQLSDEDQASLIETRQFVIDNHLCRSTFARNVKKKHGLTVTDRHVRSWVKEGEQA